MRGSVHNELQIALGLANVQLLNQSSIAEGVFPWTFNGAVMSVVYLNSVIPHAEKIFYSILDVSVGLKCKIVDRFEMLERHEELELIKREMIQYLKFYKDVIFQLKIQIKALEDFVVQGLYFSILYENVLIFMIHSFFFLHLPMILKVELYRNTHFVCSCLLNRYVANR